jgi:hypothetical protein
MAAAKPLSNQLFSRKKGARRARRAPQNSDLLNVGSERGNPFRLWAATRLPIGIEDPGQHIHRLAIRIAFGETTTSTREPLGGRRFLEPS